MFRELIDIINASPRWHLALAVVVNAYVLAVSWSALIDRVLS
jgi:hypothetical protein